MKSTTTLFVLLGFIINQTLVVGAVEDYQPPSLSIALEQESDNSMPGPETQVQTGSYHIAQGAGRNSMNRNLNRIVTKPGAIKWRGRTSLPSVDDSAPPYDDVTLTVPNGGMNIGGNGGNGGSIVFNHGQVQAGTTPGTTETVVRQDGQDPVSGLGGEVEEEKVPHNEARDNLKRIKGQLERIHGHRKAAKAHTHTQSNPPTTTHA